MIQESFSSQSFVHKALPFPSFGLLLSFHIPYFGLFFSLHIPYFKLHLSLHIPVFDLLKSLSSVLPHSLNINIFITCSQG